MRAVCWLFLGLLFASPAAAGSRPAPATGRVLVASSPWASVYIGARRLGVTPVALNLRAGWHVLRLVRSGYKELRVRVAVRPGRVMHLNRVLQRGPRWLLKRSRKAYVNGRHKQALALAQRHLASDPYDRPAWQLVGAAACVLERRALVRAAMQHVGRRHRHLIAAVCSRTGTRVSGASRTPSRVVPFIVTMSRVSPAVQQCYQRFRRAGVVRVRVAIARSGRVTRSMAIGRFAGTPTGRCVAAAVQRARFAPGRRPHRLTYPFVLR